MKKPSEEIQKKVSNIEFDWRNGCGAHNCECYENSIKINAIVEFLDEVLSDEKK